MLPEYGHIRKFPETEGAYLPLCPFGVSTTTIIKALAARHLTPQRIPTAGQTSACVGSARCRFGRERHTDDIPVGK